MNFLVQLTLLSPLIGGLLILGGMPARKTATIATLIALFSALIAFFRLRAWAAAAARRS